MAEEPENGGGRPEEKRSVEARLYQRLPDGVVQCRLCPHQCRLRPGAVGICRTRRNVDGRLIYQFYGAVSSLALDPIEKKPLYHFHPGKTILSLGSVGCNLRCGFCQNWEIAQAVDVPTRLVSSEEVVQAALELAEEGCIGVAYTYNEPAVGFEFVVDTARLAREAGLDNVMVTNGELEEEALRELLPLIDAWNVDVKALRRSATGSCAAGRWRRCGAPWRRRGGPATWR
ncbi:MAG: radical SAM protein [Bacillota bacterium]|nr:radical SAM protein [Bacillota bacterium]